MRASGIASACCAVDQFLTVERDVATKPTSIDRRRTILVVEDDKEIMDLVARYLGDNDFDVARAYDSVDVEPALAATTVDLIVLDINLPTEDGFSLCARLRRSSRVPIIMLTAKAEDIDRIIGLEIGADDYMSKPFNPRELLARIRSVIRRYDVNTDEASRALYFEGWKVDLIGRRVYNPKGTEVTLTGSEFELLVVFCENCGRVLSRDRLLQLTHGGAATGRSVDIVISRLRRKIEDDPREPRLIKTVRSGGYVFAASVRREA